MIKAVFLDRDGVICHRHIARSDERNRAVAELAGRPGLQITGEDEIRVFWKAYSETGTRDITTASQEEAFWWRWGEIMLAECGVSNGFAASRALCARYPFHTMLEAYADAPDVIRTLHERGYRLGVISNTFPSLEASIRSVGLHDCFEHFISSSLVGVEKPQPAIYEIALERMGVTAEESVFVDDLALNADGARRVGMTAFRLDRHAAGPDWDGWTIHSLRDLCDYLEGASER